MPATFLITYLFLPKLFFRSLFRFSLQIQFAALIMHPRFFLIINSLLFHKNLIFTAPELTH